MPELHTIIRGPNIKGSEVVARGKALYEKLRPEVETLENKGKIIAINVDTEAYLIADDEDSAEDTARTKFPKSNIFFYRIGVGAMHTIGFLPWWKLPCR